MELPMVERLTASAVFDLYCQLPHNEQRSFLDRLGDISIAEVPFLIANRLSRSEQFRFSKMLFEELAARSLPIFEREARILAREKAHLTDEQFDKELHERVKALLEHQGREIAALDERS